jgi:hypothetical protein
MQVSDKSRKQVKIILLSLHVAETITSIIIRLAIIGNTGSKQIKLWVSQFLANQAL